MRLRELTAAIACFILLVTSPLATYAQTSPSFEPLGLGPGGISSSAAAVSADGSVVVGGYWVPNHPFCRFPGVGDCAFTRHAFRWQGGTFQDLGVLNPNNPQAEALAVSGDGSRVVGWSIGISGFRVPFLWTAADGMQEIANISAVAVGASATGISRDGNVIVGHFLTLGVGGRDHAFLWNAGVVTDLGVLPGVAGSRALGVCGLGAAVVGSGTFGTAWRWRPNVGMENLGAGVARGCSDDGSVVVGDSFGNNTTLAFRWDPKNGLRTLGTFGGVGSGAEAASADGSVVVGGAGLPFVLIGGLNTSEFTAFRWSAGKLSQLSRVLQSLGVTTPFCHSFSDASPCPPGSWFVAVGNGVSADGSTIVGIAVDPDGNDQAFRAVVPTANAVCTPTTCVAQRKNCGTIPNGCGGTLNCGVCTAPQTCGGGGVANVCGVAACTPTTCAAQGKNCGTIPNGCGGTLNCGVCTAPQTCGGGGIANVCGVGTVSTALLTVTATGRAGETVSSTPAGLTVNVGTTGTASFTTGTSVTLSVSNGRSAIWSGGCSSAGAKVKTCSFTINAATSVTANVQ